MDSAKSDYMRTLRRLPLFTGLSDAELIQIAEGVRRLYFEEGTLIFGEGDVCRELQIVEGGTGLSADSFRQTDLKNPEMAPNGTFCRRFERTSRETTMLSGAQFRAYGLAFGGWIPQLDRPVLHATCPYLRESPPRKSAGRFCCSPEM